MKIKNLSLRGFKSFVDKSTLHIPQGISAFVGPNGCGKSNVVDAIRWVMGEQGPKQLRGRQMEDMIFSGARELKPLGMAEVTLTLEDAEEFYGDSEVSVTRRLYRSNESEYLINSAPCRLKDIQDLFMGTGLGNRSYSIIAQGEIGSIIEQKPEEMRRLLEEAAGITKYKARREEASRKVALTKENLTRVEDLLEEIKRGMNSLKRQAHKARKFKEASSEIHRLELVLNAYNYHELNAEKENRKRIIEELTEKAKDAEVGFSGSEQVIESTSIQLRENEKKASDLKESIFSLREEGRRNEDALQQLLVEQQRLKTVEDKLRREKEDTGQKLLRFRSESKGIDARVEELHTSIQELTGLRSRHNSALRNKRLTVDGIKAELNGQKQRLTELAADEARLRGEIGNLSETISQVEMRKGGLEAESKEIAKKIEAISFLLNEKRGSSEELHAKVRSVEKALQAAITTREELAALREQTESERAVVDSEIALGRSELKTLAGFIERYEGYESGVQTIMNSLTLNSGKGSKILGVLADFIEVDPDFELPVEAVLAERLQYVIVARQEDGKEAVEYLRSTERGRSYFLPLKEFKNDHPLDYAEVSLNGLRLLREHVSAPAKYSPLIKSLLGNAALVDNLSEALSIWKKDNGRQTLVTPEGDVVDSRGVIIGGRLGKESLGLLTSRRRRRGLKNEITEKEHLSANMERKLGTLISQLGDLGAQIDDLANEKKALSGETDALDKDILLLGKESEQLVQHSQYVVDQLGLLRAEKEQKVSRLASLEERISRCIMEKSEAERTFAEKEAKLAELEGALEEIKDALSQLSVRYSGYGEEEKGLLREKERLDQFTSEMELRARTVQEEMDTTTNDYKDSLIKEKQLRENLAVTNEKLMGLEKEGSELERKSQLVKETLREEERKSALVREEIDTLRDQINDAKIREAEVDFQVNGIVSQVRKETGINLQRDFKGYLDENFPKEHYESKLDEYRLTKERIGEVNLLAITEYEKLKERYDFIRSQQQDLLASIDSLNTVIRRINRVSRRKFLSTLAKVDEQLKRVFPILFDGGSARLRLIDENLPLESGLLVEVQPPGKKLVHMGLLSGGEKALAAVALLFAIYLIRPSPFIVIDEVDAPLDEANTERFNDLLQEIRKSSQVLMVTHNRKAMEVAERLYGIVMDKTGVSKIVSVNLQDYQQSQQ
jgi:chromosome segregation protein